MKKFMKSIFMVLGFAFVLSFASCSNGSGDEINLIEEHAEINGNAVTFTGNTALQAIKAEEFAKYKINTMAVYVKLEGSVADQWWAGIENPDWLLLEWEDNPTFDGYNYKATATKALIEDAKKSGIWIKANPGLTANTIVVIN
jgi:hypothetical protein